MDRRELLRVLNSELELSGQHQGKKKERLVAIIMEVQEVNLPPPPP
jgi:hypothetical protein